MLRASAASVELGLLKRATPLALNNQAILERRRSENGLILSFALARRVP
jgi:hypothetical protein